MLFFNAPATTEIYTLSLHDALPICSALDNDLIISGPWIAPHHATIRCDNQTGLTIEIGASVTIQLPSSAARSEEHTSELQSLRHLVCRLLLEKKKKHRYKHTQRQHK